MMPTTAQTRAICFACSVGGNGMKSGFGGPANPPGAPPGAPPAPAGAPPAPPGGAPPAEGSIAFSKVERPGEAFLRGEGKERISDRRQGRSREDDPALSSKQQSAKTLTWIKTLFSDRDKPSQEVRKGLVKRRSRWSAPENRALGCISASRAPQNPSSPRALWCSGDKIPRLSSSLDYFGRPSMTDASSAATRPKHTVTSPHGGPGLRAG